MPEENVPAIKPKRGRLRLLIFLILLVAAYLTGFIPMWQKARAETAQREQTGRALTVMRITKDLGSAAIDARRGAYEPARQEASAFFTAANFELDQRDQSALTRDQREALAPVLSSRDEVITLLARNDQASGDRLATLYVAVRKALGV